MHPLDTENQITLGELPMRVVAIESVDEHLHA